MFTLRFESDAGLTWMVETRSFRVHYKESMIDIAIPNENNVDIYHPIAKDKGFYDRLFVMNSSGKTVAKFEHDSLN